MSKVNTTAFMAGYMNKEANPLGGSAVATGANRASNAAAAQRTMTPEQMEAIGDKGVQQAGQNVNQQWLSSQGNRDLATMGGGAALGGGLGYMMGGDAGSALMGTALGGLVGWLAKHFFGADINKAYDSFQRWMNQGTAEGMVKNLAKSDPNAAAALEATGINTKTAIAEKQKNDAGAAIDAAKASDDVVQRNETRQALDLADKADADALKGAAPEAATPKPAGIGDIKVPEGQMYGQYGTDASPEQGMDVVEPVAQPGVPGKLQASK